jgi:hypothetical protein
MESCIATGSAKVCISCAKDASQTQYEFPNGMQRSDSHYDLLFRV